MNRNTLPLFTLCVLFAAGPAAAAEVGGWSTVCEVPDMELAAGFQAIPGPVDTSLAEARQAWLRHGNDYAVLTMPDCKVRAVAMPAAPNSASMRFVSTAGYLLGSWDAKTRHTTWWVGGASLRPLEGPPDSITSGSPILSTDGRWVAWIEAPPGDPRSRRVMLHSLDDGRQQIVDLPPSEWWLVGADMQRQELTFFEYNVVAHYAGLVVLGLDGARRGTPLLAEGAEPQAPTFLRVGAGWVAWDATRDGAFQPFRIAWSVSAGKGSHETTPGRSVTAVAVNPAGTYVAVSETDDTRINLYKDSVYVLRTRDGKRVWQRTLPAFARSSLAFLGDDLFAYTEVSGARSTVRVLRIGDSH